LSTKEFFPLTIDGSRGVLRFVDWSPIGSSLIISFQNNLFYKKDPTAKEIQITFDGDWPLSNGIPDWVYEEEVLTSNFAVWFSPDASKLAYIKI
jgi:hypothetical protein